MDGNLSLTDFIAIHKYFAVYCVRAEGLLTPWNLVRFWLKLSLEILKSWNLEIFPEIQRFWNLMQIFSVRALRDTVLTHKHGTDLSRAVSLEWAHNICVVCPKEWDLGRHCLILRLLPSLTLQTCIAHETPHTFMHVRQISHNFKYTLSG